MLGRSYLDLDSKQKTSTMSYSSTSTYTYDVTDVETSFRRFNADLMMIADSSKAITRDEANNYAHDAEYLAKNGFLKHVDVTLMVGETEHRAARYSISDQAGGLATSRPGGVLWPNLIGGWIRIILKPTDTYTVQKREATQRSLKIDWTPTSADTSHVNLTLGNGRNYVSNAYGLQRNDFS